MRLDNIIGNIMYKLEELNYSYEALEPVIDAKTVEIHHTKHHANYLNKMNAILEKNHVSDEYPLTELVNHLDLIDEADHNAFLFNFGGVVNHNLYFSILGTNGLSNPGAGLEEDINKTFGSYEAFKDLFAAKANGFMGSGWVMLVYKDNDLSIITLKNQDNPYSLGYTPLIALDLWEHAYYLKYQNLRTDYIAAFFSILDFDVIEKLYEEA